MIYILIISIIINIVTLSFIVLKKATPKENKNSKELADFMTDIKKYGYGVVRIDPDSILYITPKKRR